MVVRALSCSASFSLSCDDSIGASRQRLGQFGLRRFDLGRCGLLSLLVSRLGLLAHRLAGLQFGNRLGRGELGLLVVLVLDLHAAGAELVEPLDARLGCLDAQLEEVDLGVDGGEVAGLVGLRLIEFRLGGQDLLLARAFGRVAGLRRLRELRPRDLHLLIAVLRALEFGDFFPLLENGAGRDGVELGDPVARRTVDRHDSAGGLEPPERGDAIRLGGRSVRRMAWLGPAARLAMR